MLVVNLFGGPGCGKSTIAAGIFYRLKTMGINCEYVQEYAKSRVWENAISTLEDQIYVFAKQNHAIWRVYNKVDVVITDSPILLSVIYGKNMPKEFNELVHTTFGGYNNLNYFIDRDNSLYQECGRLQKLNEVFDIDKSIYNLLKNYEFKSFSQRLKNFDMEEIIFDIGKNMKWGNA